MISYATMFVRLQTSADIFCGCLLVRAGWRVRPSYFKEAGSLRFSVWGGLENGKRVLKMKFTLRSLNFNLSWSSQVHALKVCHPVMQSQHESLDHDTLPTCLNPTSNTLCTNPSRYSLALSISCYVTTEVGFQRLPPANTQDCANSQAPPHGVLCFCIIYLT